MRQAAINYYIPKSTLGDWESGRLPVNVTNILHVSKKWRNVGFGWEMRIYNVEIRNFSGTLMLIESLKAALFKCLLKWLDISYRRFVWDLLYTVNVSLEVHKRCIHWIYTSTITFIFLPYHVFDLLIELSTRDDSNKMCNILVIRLINI